MNGEPLAPEHSAPLRVVAPGYIGARSVKWLASIELQEEPSSNYYQTHAYKIFPPQVNEETADWGKGLMLGELSVNSVICQPTDEETVPAGPVSVRGYAITGGERSVERVDVSVDGGKTWTTADLQEGNDLWAWLMTALMILVVLLFLTPLFYYLPNAALAAVILVAVYGLLDFEEACHIFRIRASDGLALLITLFLTILVGVEQGIIAGALFALLVFIRRTAYPRIRGTPCGRSAC